MGNSGGKILWKNLVGNSGGKILWEILVGNLADNFCGKILWENLVGQGGGKSQFKKGSDWWKFSIWNRVMGSQPIRIQLGKILRKNLVGKSCGKFLRENLADNFCGKILWDKEGGKANLRKAVIGGNLAFGIG